MDDAPRITVEDLKRRMDEGEEIVPVDVRRSAWDRSDEKIAGAIRLDPSRFEDEFEQVPKGATVATYCT